MAVYLHPKCSTLSPYGLREARPHPREGGEMERSEQILDFWFGELSDDGWGFERERLDYWFNGGPAVDAELRERFGEDLARAERGELDAWVATPRGRLALVLVLDQL